MSGFKLATPPGDSEPVAPKQQALYDLVRKTPLTRLEKLSGLYNTELWLKREDLQPVHSFKLRGAYWHLLNRLPQCQSGVIAASAGNHAQGVALAARHLNIEATIVMPVTTPAIKVDAVSQLGGQVILYGENFDQAKAHAEQLAKLHGLHLIPPFDDPLVISGQGSIGDELFQQMPELDAVFLPVGGGGLVAGVARQLKRHNPKIRVIGVEAEESACMSLAFALGRPAALASVGCFADGTAVKQAGALTFALARDYCDQMITVDNDQICAAIKDIFTDSRAIAEPSGALALAGLKQFIEIYRPDWQSACALLSGANLNFDSLRYIAERCVLGEKKEALFAVEIAEQPGSFSQFVQTLGHFVVTEFNYRYQNADIAQVIVSLLLKNGASDLAEIHNNLRQAGLNYLDLSHDEIAKSHLRYMVGGQGNTSQPEAIFKFSFPEKAGALEHFLQQLGNRWNISLFHYRHQGNAYGEVLIGFQLGAKGLTELEQFLPGIGYAFEAVSSSLAYRFFSRNSSRSLSALSV